MRSRLAGLACRLSATFVTSIVTIVGYQYQTTILNRERWCYPANPRYIYLWVGPTAEAPVACPDWATMKVIDAHGGLSVGDFDCPTCGCAPSETTCAPPAAWTAVARACGEPPEGGELFFGAPETWTGACSNQSSIPADLACVGGEACAQSMIVSAPETSSAPCAPERSGDLVKADPAWTWEVTALGCVEDPPKLSGDCPNGVLMLDEPPDGFLLCTESIGEVCPPLTTGAPDEAVEFLLYRGAEDHRTCSPCGCGEPEGNGCSVEVAAYSDAACVNEAGSAVVTSTDGEACFDLPDGTALGSKRAKLLEVSPGTCAPTGGVVMGDVEPIEPIRFCCEKYN